MQTPGGAVPVKPPPRIETPPGAQFGAMIGGDPACGHPDRCIRYYGNQHGSGSKCTRCGVRLTWIPRGALPNAGPAERPEQSAAQAARTAAAQAQRAVEILQENDGFASGAAALNTVNQLGGLLQSLQWQLSA
eukprot:6495749-Pyramimonas_sp.AAC.1